MAWYDFLKGIIPEKLINVNVDNRKIEIRDSKIIMGDQIIENKEIIDKFFKEIEKHKTENTLPFQLIHKDLESEYFEYEQISIKEKESIRKLLRVLPPHEIECILMARRVFLAFEKGDQELWKSLISQLEDNHPKHGKKVYNLISAGYFDELVLPFIDVMKSEHGDDKYVEEYKSFYEDIMKFFPIAIFVGNHTMSDKLKEEILIRLNLKDIPFIRLHAFGYTNIKKVEDVTAELDIDKTYPVKDSRFNAPTGLKAQIYEIKIKRGEK